MRSYLPWLITVWTYFFLKTYEAVYLTGSHLVKASLEMEKVCIAEWTV